VRNNDITDTGNDGAEPARPAEKARGSFDVRGKREARPIKTYVMIGALLLILFGGVVGVWTFFIGKMTQSSSEIDESKAVADATLNAKTSSDDSMKQHKAEKLKKLEEEEQKKQEQEVPTKQQEAPAKPPTNFNTAQTSPGMQDAPPKLTPAQRKLGGGVMLQANVNDVSSYPGASGGTPNVPSQSSADRSPGDSSDLPLASLGGSSGSSSRGSLGDLSGPDFASTKATLAPAGKYLLSHGTYGRCALYPEIITEHPGLVDCRLTEPLYSADGSTVIAEAGSRMSGLQKVQMTAGQASVFTAWTSLETTAGVRAQLNSLGAGPMGASGTKAWIDNHYAQRYGGAVMLSFIQDALKAASNTTQRSSGSGGYTINSSEQNVASMADKALDSTINIPPTGYILPGTVITVIVARDIDFSAVYENH
jgi:type IV secretion system protein VirB10